MTAAPQAPVVCILDSGTNEAGAEGWNYLAGNEDLTDEAGHGDLIYQLLESETPNARLIMLKCFESAEETEEKKGKNYHYKKRSSILLLLRLKGGWAKLFVVSPQLIW